MFFRGLRQFGRPGCWRFRARLSPYLDGELPAAEIAQLENHLAGCAACREQLARQRFAAGLVASLPMPVTEVPVWTRPANVAQPDFRPRIPAYQLAAAAALLIIAAAGILYLLRPRSVSWEVTQLSGQPVIEAQAISKMARWHIGEWLETDGVSRALIHVGQIGQVEVDPESRVRLVKIGENEYRLQLARGRLYASIVAPPRMFQVETPSAVAIDLGCAYILEVDEAGGSVLRVTSGWVALARNGREAFVPAGAAAKAEADGRLGTPYFEDASGKFQRALSRFDFGDDRSTAFADLLSDARARDALTLWHLLPRVEGEQRERLYHRLVALVPAASDLGKDSTLRLEPAVLAKWKDAVEFASLGVDPRQVPIAAGTLKPVGPMLATRQSHTATLLPDGKILLAGGSDRVVALVSAELFDPATGSFSETGSMTVPRAAHEATLLPNGKVLITGGLSQENRFLASAELYDPVTGRFTPTGSMQIAREAHCATLLKNGKVLITGGLSDWWPRQRLAEIYDPATGQFLPAGEMTVLRADHTATLLANGQVLLSAGSTGRSINEAVTDTAELFDPANNRFAATGKLAVPRHKHAAVALPDGKVLVIGGADSRLRGFYNSAELYDPVTGRFSATGSMSTARYKFRDAAVLLNDGKVLVAGGGTRLEIYDPAKGIFSLLPDRVTTALRYSTTTLLNDGTALMAGGYGSLGLPSAGAWLYVPSSQR